MKSARAGFTLLESIVALFVVGIAAIAALETVGGQLRAHERIQRALEAEVLAEHRLSLIQLLFYEEFQNFPDSLARGRFDEPFDAYSWSTNVEELHNDYENLFKVDLTVSWEGGSYGLNSYYYRRPQTITITPQGGRQGGPP